MKSLMSLLQELLNELSSRCCASTNQDLKKILARVEGEGLSFLTITLPNYCKDFEKSLDNGYVDRNAFLGFARKGGLPLFLGGFLDRIFDRGTGRLLDSPCIESIIAIRQLTLFYSKIELPCTPVRERKAMRDYIKCEKELRISDSELTSAQKADFVRLSNLLWAPVLSVVDQSIYYQEIVPKHGPGSTADKLIGNNKYKQTEWTERLEEVFPSGEYLIPNPRYHYTLASLKFLEPGAERPVRVISVPKTLKTPRIIAIEPTCMQYMQQAISEKLVTTIRETYPLSKMVLFDDQRPNQLSARLGSLKGDLATLDLSEASDRVSNQHVRLLCSRFPHLARGLDSTRSRKADVLGHGVVRLAKFASMGSALTFPLEAIVFTTVIFYGIEQELSRRLTRRDIQSLSSQVRVFGDDIIVPKRYARCVVEALETFGFRVNLGKSFWTGQFRESCGKEYFAGNDVSIVRCRRLIPTRRTDVPEIISTASLRNHLYKAGLWKTARYLDTVMEGLIPFPTVAETSPVLGRHSFLGFETQKMCPSLHRPLVKGYVQRTVIPPTKLEDHGALLKCLLKRGDKPFADSRHLERSGRPKAVSIKLGWAPSL